ncbi:MAG: hypothetical protein IPL56_19705 [Saprospiraceae bacterium]|nr:hypothetical protein [Saprospiraceae bacterium]
MEDLFFSPTENPLNDTFTVTNAGGGQGAFTNLITVLELRDNWSGAGNTSTSNDSYASNSRLSVPIFGVGPLVSDALDITQFGFNIPTSATILGITATIERSANRRDASNNVTDNKITLIRGEVPIITPPTEAQNKANPITWSVTDSVVSYGGSTDLWLHPWTPAEINSSTFGIRVRNNRNRSSGTVTANIDHITLAVTYMVPPKSQTPASVATVSSNGDCAPTGTTTWSNVTAANLSSDNSVYANTITVQGGIDTTNCLEVSDFGFCICPTAVIDSITVEIDRSQGFLGALGFSDIVTDVKVVLVQPNGTEAQNKANTSLNWPIADARASYGGDNWGVSWTPAMVNDPAFAVRVQARIENSFLISQARIDEITVQIHCHFPDNIKVYVDSAATGLNDGSSWANAFTNLQDGLNDCFVDTICVAKGTYYPASVGRDTSFNIPDSVVMLGGFNPATGDTALADRNWVCNKTILCGDIDQNGDTVGNSIHVVTTINVTGVVVDGFHITGGNANAASGSNAQGAGWYSASTNQDTVDIIIRNSNIYENYSMLQGAGLANVATVFGRLSKMSIYNSIIAGNASASNGGGFMNASENNVSANNTADLSVYNTIISGNFAANTASAVLNRSNRLNTNNFVSNSRVLLTNVVIAADSSASLSPFDATIDNREAGNGMGDNLVEVFNSIFVNNSSPYIIRNTGTSQSTITNSILPSGVSNDATLLNIKFDDPLFMMAPLASAAPTTDGDFHVMFLSPAIDMGNNSYNTFGTDLDGLNRIVNGIIDIGPYEKLLNCDTDTLYVDIDGNVPDLPVDSLLLDTIPDGYHLIVLDDGVSAEYLDTESIPFDCDDKGANDLQLWLTNDCDTIDLCHKIVEVLDTFPKKLVGNDQLNVSLDQNCMKVIGPDDVLQNVQGCRNAFEVSLIYPHGTNTYDPPNKVDISHVGYCMVYSVREIATNNKTWGKICVEDKAPPRLNCRNDTVSCFEFNDLPLLAEPINDCSGDEVKLIGDRWVDWGCDSAYLGYVERTIWGSDRWNNSQTCTSTLYIRKTSLDSVDCPEDFEFPCTITYQLGGYIHPKELKVPIAIDKNKLTPEFLLSLQKSTWEFKDGTKDRVLNPSIPVVPNVDGHSVYLAASGICKINATYTDKPLAICGTGVKIRREWTILDWCTLTEKTCVQYLSIDDKVAPVPTNKELGVVASSPHDCGQYVDLPALKYEDCNDVNQTYLISILEEGVPRVLRGDLPASRVWLPVGAHTIKVRLVDACYNESEGYITVAVVDITPPTPICVEVTQTTVDPATCWSAIAAKDLDNGSRDNCCNVLHFAAAPMDSITYWRNYWNTTLETEVGKEAFWKDKDNYDALIEDWINCYVFSDTVHFDECGTNQVVLRVYEACGVPRFDPHIFPCSPHAWFCYNTYLHLGDFNYNWFDSKGPKSCNYRPGLTSISKLDERYAGYYTKGYFEPKYIGAAQYDYCQVPFYFPNLIAQCDNVHKVETPPGKYCSQRLYNDCMVTVLVDDKMAPVVNHLEDITIYCDGAPDYAGYPNCEHSERFDKWPLQLKDSKGVVHGYYGGSDFLGIHTDPADHSDPDACEWNKGWAPIYCRSWLYLDSFDQAGHVNPKDYFSTLVKVDKKRPLDHVLKSNEFTITDNCRLDDATLTVVDNGTLNGCSEGWIQRSWTIKDKCGNAVTATQKIIVKHRSDFEVIFPEDKVVTCDPDGSGLNRTDTGHAGVPIIKDDECEQIGVRYSDEIFTVEDSACYKIVRTWTLIDWCIYDPNQHNHYPDVIVNDSLRANSTNRSCVYRNIKDNNDGYMTYIQIIKVIDETPPVVTTRDTTVCVYSDNCLVSVVIPLSATDNCAAASDIRFRYFIDLNATDAVYNGRLFDPTSIDQGGTQYVKDFVFLLGQPGRHVVHVVGIDNCGNADTSSFRFDIKDCKKPTPYCLDGLATVIMPSTGRITVWAKDFDHGAEDNCTAKADLKFSFGPDTLKTSREFTCADIRDGKLDVTVVDVYVTDKAGNNDFCKVTLQLQDNPDAANGLPHGACPDTTAMVAILTGKLQTEEQEGVESATVAVQSPHMTSPATLNTVSDGTYSFSSMPMNDQYTIQARRNDNPMNGVSTLDLVLIQKHIMGSESLSSAYKVIAADVDNNHDVNAIDLVELRKLILGIYDKLPNNTSWKFVPRSYVFTEIANPWNYPVEGQIDHMSGDTKVDFVGIKIGDVNATAAAHSLMGTEVRGSGSGLILEVKDRTFKAGERVEVSFTSPNFKGVSGFQGTLMNGSLRFDGVKSNDGILSLSNQNFGTRWASEGLTTMSWNTNRSVDLDDKDILFTLIFTAQSSGSLSEVLRVSSQKTLAESYEGKGELGNLSIRFISQNGQEITYKISVVSKLSQSI